MFEAIKCEGVSQVGTTVVSYEPFGTTAWM